MKHFLVRIAEMDHDSIVDEFDLLIGAVNEKDALIEAVEIVDDEFPDIEEWSAKIMGELTEEEAENSGLDEY